VNVVDSEEESSNSKSLVECLEEAPQKIFDVMTATSKNYLTHMIGVVKSYLPQFNLAPVAKGIAPNCSDKKFQDYCKESELIAEKILKTWQSRLLVTILVICSDFLSLFIAYILLVYLQKHNLIP
jgi:hypothetical protein